MSGVQAWNFFTGGTVLTMGGLERGVQTVDHGWGGEAKIELGMKRISSQVLIH